MPNTYIIPYRRNYCVTIKTVFAWNNKTMFIFMYFNWILFLLSEQEHHHWIIPPLPCMSSYSGTIVWLWESRQGCRYFLPFLPIILRDRNPQACLQQNWSELKSGGITVIIITMRVFIEGSQNPSSRRANSVIPILQKNSSNLHCKLKGTSTHFPPFPVSCPVHWTLFLLVSLILFS